MRSTRHWLQTGAQLRVERAPAPGVHLKFRRDTSDATAAANPVTENQRWENSGQSRDDADASLWINISQRTTHRRSHRRGRACESAGMARTVSLFLWAQQQRTCKESPRTGGRPQSTSERANHPLSAEWCGPAREVLEAISFIKGSAAQRFDHASCRRHAAACALVGRAPTFLRDKDSMVSIAPGRDHLREALRPDQQLYVMAQLCQRRARGLL